jgi:hypothetical protein
MIHNHWLRITQHDSYPLTQYNSVILNHWLSIVQHDAYPLAQYITCWASGYETWCVMLSQWLWIMVCHTEPVVVNHGVLYWASAWESLCVILSQWLWIMVCYAEPVVVNHDVILSQLFRIIVCYIEPVAMNHGVLYWVSGCASWCAKLIYDVLCWASDFESNNWLSITHHDSQPLPQHSTPGLTTTGST